MEDLFAIVGLGNPGARYRDTRHNVGFDTIDLLSYKNNIKISRLKFKALTGEGLIHGKRVILVKPQTYMNLSGESVRDVVEWYKMPLQNLILVYDDADIPPGRIRLRPKGSSGTHKGMQSVIYQLQSDEFPRIRIGIGGPPENWDIADYVLSKFTEDERKLIDKSIIKAAKAAVSIVESGIETAMNIYNRADAIEKKERQDSSNELSD